MTRDLYPHLPALTALNMDEMLRAFKLHSFAGVRQIAYWSLYKLVEQLSGFALEYDARVGTQGLVSASDWLLSQVTGGVNVSGHEAIPQSGPLLVVSNHPGLTDAMAIFATLRRDDLRIVAAERAILQLLPNIERYLIYVPDDPNQRRQAVRQVAAHLRAGGAVLNFPFGAIESDPALYPDAGATLAEWSRSIELFARLAPAAPVLPVAVSGVLSPAALRHPVARLYRTRKDRDWAAASLQFLLRRYQTGTVSLRYGTPVYGDRPYEAAVAQMAAMIESSHHTQF